MKLKKWLNEMNEKEFLAYQYKMARELKDTELINCALVSIQNNCTCSECFCCVCKDILTNTKNRTLKRKLYFIKNKYTYND